MDEFEKVEKLRQRANVTYEEAREALKECNGDLLDAMVYLEKQGKVNAPESSVFKTSYEEQTQYKDVPATVLEQQKNTDKKSFGEKFKHLCKIIWEKLRDNTLLVERKGKEVIKLPLWATVLILLFAWHVILVAVLISLFFDFHYSLEGEGDLEKANKVMEKATEAADHVKQEFDKL